MESTSRKSAVSGTRMEIGRPATIYFLNPPEQGDNQVYIVEHARHPNPDRDKLARQALRMLGLQAIEKFMSTGENINANGSVLTADMIRGGFNKFPQSDVVLVGPELWPQIAPLQIAAGYPFKADQDDTVPPGELWYIGDENPEGPESTKLLGRIINIGLPTENIAGT